MKRLLAASLAALVVTAGAAHAEDFSFSFQGDNGSTGQVTGTVYGLADVGTSTPTQVAAMFTGGRSYTFTPNDAAGFYGQFTVDDNQVTSFVFSGEDYTDSNATWYLALSSSYDELITFDATITYEEEVTSTDDPTAVTFRPVTTAPEPSSWVLMIVGAGLAGASLRQRRRAGSACAA